ncbi:MAG: cysteine desulfurase [Planctomycetaceae bacterium]|nr:cysteine desulfurase [Planctomycetaceae bacterium]
MPDTVIYLDHHATTPVAPEVRAAMEPWWREKFGNPSSSHRLGRVARQAVDEALGKIATAVGAAADDVILTSGATEANNLAMKGVLSRGKGRPHVVTSAGEHSSILVPLKSLARRQAIDLTVVPLTSEGLPDPAAVLESLRPETELVSLILASHEVGAVTPLEEIYRECESRGVWLHTDASQALGRLPLVSGRFPAHLVSLSAHKCYGPQGIGAVVLRPGSRRLRLEPLLEGGGQQQQRRGGTIPVALAVGFGTAAELATNVLPGCWPQWSALVNRLWAGLSHEIPDLHWNGPKVTRLPGNLHVSISDVDGPALLVGLDRVVVSSGSACTVGDGEPSPVLKAMGLDDRLATASLRFGLGRETTSDEIDAAVDEIARVVNQLRSAPKSPIMPSGDWAI